MALVACAFDSFGSKHFLLMITGSRLSESPQAASHSYYYSVYQAGSACFAEYSMF